MSGQPQPHERDPRTEPGAAAPGSTRCPGDVGLEIRSAIHTGEIEIRDEDVGGIGVHIAARALTQAADRDVVVTRAVRDLATGADLAFARSAR